MKPVILIAEGSENLYWDREEALAESDGWITPLYKRRKWIGLTDEEVDEFSKDGDGCFSSSLLETVRAIEAKLKEKNT